METRLMVGGPHDGKIWSSERTPVHLPCDGGRYLLTQVSPLATVYQFYGNAPRRLWRKKPANFDKRLTPSVRF